MKDFIKKLFKWDDVDIDDVLYRNEIKSNRVVALTLLIVALIMPTIYILRYYEVIEYKRDPFDMIIWIVFALNIAPVILTFILRGRGKWLKFIMILSLFISVTAICLFWGAAASLLMVLPLIIATRYNKRYITIISAFIGVVVLVVSRILAYKITGYIDYRVLTDSQILNFLFDGSVDETQYNHSLFTYSIIPESIMYLAVSYVCIMISDNGTKLLQEEKLSAENNAKISSELELARSIQLNMLPKSLDDEDNDGNYLVDAMMVPAKEVGGDFYDYFSIDESHICVLVADVSGKGVASGMFMAKAKTLIRSKMLDHSLSDVFKIVNNDLCEGNVDGLFITAWIGILSLDNGELNYTNAGHTPPLIMTKKGVKTLKQEPNFVLAGMEDVEYESFTYKMQEGETLILYTDGITEALNKEKKLYGEERFISLLNDFKGEPNTLLQTIKEDVDKFSSSCPQTDDITLLSLKFIKKQKNIISKEFLANVNNVKEVLDYTSESLDALKVKKEEQAKIKIIVEEIYLNIANYAYKYHTGKAYIGFKKKDKLIQITFKDQGSPFNPLTYAHPNIQEGVEEREVGGLGIHMVITMSDDIKYRYDGSNILTVFKKVS